MGSGLAGILAGCCFGRTRWRGSRRGEIDVAFRWWTKPTVKAGGFLQTAVGRLAIVSLEPIRVADVTVADAKRAGFPTKAALLKAFPRKRGSRLYRVEFVLAGAGSADRAAGAGGAG